MPDNTVPTTIPELLAAATQTTSNIAKHREAMAQVAAQAKANAQAQAKQGGETK